MTVSALSAARTICELRDWSVSNLELQKILFLAHMLHLGRSATPLVHEQFEAWDYGPVIPELYQRVKGFGSGPIRNVFHWVPAVDSGSPEYEVLAETAAALKKFSPGQLVAVTHMDGGAWAQNYRPKVRGIKIPNSAIFEEYQQRDRSTAARHLRAG